MKRLTNRLQNSIHRQKNCETLQKETCIKILRKQKIPREKKSNGGYMGRIDQLWGRHVRHVAKEKTKPECFTTRRKKIYDINDFNNSSKDESDDFFVYTVEDRKADKAEEWFSHLKTNGTELQYKLDTESQVNIIKEQLFNNLRRNLKSIYQKSN